jgi:hypothetical protein
VLSRRRIAEIRLLFALQIGLGGTGKARRNQGQHWFGSDGYALGLLRIFTFDCSLLFFFRIPLPSP